MDRPGLQRARCVLAALCVLASGQLAWATPPRVQLRPTPAQLAEVKGFKKPWDDPEILGNPARREGMEFGHVFGDDRSRPPQWLRAFEEHRDWQAHPERLPPTILLGDLLFHAPSILGPKAALFGMSCASCHPSGSTSPDVDVGVHSDRPGNVDLLSDYFSPLPDDGIFNPRNVPSLRGARSTAPYGHGGNVASLGDFVDHVVTFELVAPPLKSEWRAALVFYLEQLDFLPNPQLDELGRLTERASAAAQSGQKLFRAERPALGGLSCASCHVPDAQFTDRRSHALRHGQHFAAAGETFDTPSLLNLAETAPYFYDGSADTLREAVTQIDSRHHLGMSVQEQDELTAYLEAVGAVPEPRSVPPVALQLRRPAAYLNLLVGGPLAHDAALWTTALDTSRHLLRGLQRDQGAELQPAVREAIDAFLAFEAQPEHRTPSAANRTALSALRTQLLQAATPAKGTTGAKR